MARTTSTALVAVTLALGAWTTGALAQRTAPPMNEGPSSVDSMRPQPGNAPPTSRSGPVGIPGNPGNSSTDSMRPQRGNAPATSRATYGASPQSTSNSVTDSGSINSSPGSRRRARPGSDAAMARTSDQNSAYMGGGMIMERGPDGVMRPVN